MRFPGFNDVMILKFPDLNTLRLAVINGAVPANVSASGAVAGFDGDQCLVETSGTLSVTNKNELKKIGVQVLPARATWPAGLAKTEVSSWAEILPLERDRGPVERLEQTPVLFDLADGEELARLVIEVLRLGNDRQSFRWLVNPAAPEGEDARALLRVVGPPYYSLLRAMDRIGGRKAPVAYVERAPRVWVELGYAHPLIGQIKAPANRILTIRPPRQWTLLDDAPFKDVYENMEFLLPDGKVTWKDGKLDDVLKVKMSLRPGGSADAAEFWVLTGDPIAELNTFVQNSSDETIQRLSFAVGEKGGKKSIVVRVRQSRQAPPVLIFRNAQAYKHYQKMPNLFVPAGFLLHPNLRRDQLRKLLCEDQSQVTWLEPAEKGAFKPMNLPEDSFRPLWDWIDYVLDYEKEPLQAWVQAAQFDFEAFVSDEDSTTKPRKPPSEGKQPKGGRDRPRNEPTGDANFMQAAEHDDKAQDVVALEDFAEIKKAEPTQIQKDLKALEESFLALEGGLDQAERQEMWPRLAALNTQLKNVDDAGVCWLNAMWERDESAARSWAWHWFVSEAGAVPARGEGKTGRSAATSWVSRAVVSKNREVPGEDLDRLLENDEPATADLRALAGYLTHAALQPSPSPALLDRLGQLSRFLEAHEKLLPIRAVWMAWTHLTKLSRGDVLNLARARDRVLERLYHNGLRPEQDLPSFLRFAGQPTSQRFRAVRQWLNDLANMAQKWLEESGNTATTPNTARTSAYVDLLFSFGLARLGETDPARDLMGRAKGMMAGLNEAHTWLYNAFEHRIKQALDGKSPTGPLPTEQLEYLEHVERLERYVVDRLRKHSSILEPDQRINPYRHWGARISEFEKAIAELTDLTDRNEIASRVDKLLREVPKGARGTENRARVLRAGLEAAPRVGEEFARKLLELTIAPGGAYDSLPEAKEIAPLMDQAHFLEKALFVAGHFGRVEAIHPLVTRFQKMLISTPATLLFAVLEQLARSAFRGLRKLGMRDEIDQILRQMAELVLKGRDVKSVDFKKEEQGPAALRSLLLVAGQWYYFGRDSQAEPILQVARQVLLSGDLPAREQTQLATAYVSAVGEAPVEVAQKRFEEVFKQLKGIKDTYTTSSHFSVSQLDVVEAVVLSAAGENFTQGTQARRWLDDDEFLVRRRIHSDLRTLMERG